MSVVQILTKCRWLLILWVLLCLGLCLGCDRQAETPVKVSLATVDINKNTSPRKTAPDLRVAISAVVSPKETFILYKDLLGYISKQLNVSVQLIQRETYEEVNNLVRDKQLDLAFVCSGAYIDGHDQFGMELLVAPVAYGQSVYHSYVIVPADSRASSLEDLRHKRFAFTDPMSNSGMLAPVYMLAEMNEDKDSFFHNYIFTYSHDRSIELVAHNLVDGAAVDGLIWEYIKSADPDLAAKTRIIRRSAPFGIPPVVVPPGLDPRLKTKLRSLFLNIHTTEEGRKILARLQIDKFIVVDDHAYDSIRKMRSFVASR